MPVKFTWSYSSIELFDQCPHKYYRLRVSKDIKEPPSEHQNYGKLVHKVLENFLKKDTPIPEKFSFLEDAATQLKAYKGTKHCEYRMGLTQDLQPCEFFARDVWWRGVVDLLVLDGETAKVIDYKTGKSAKYADTKQLELLSLAVFKHFPEVKHVKAGLLFLVAKDFIKEKYDPSEADSRWKKWLDRTAQLEKTYEADVWNPSPNFTCRKYCPVKDCIYNGD